MTRLESLVVGEQGVCMCVCVCACDVRLGTTIRLSTQGEVKMSDRHD